MKLIKRKYIDYAMSMFMVVAIVVVLSFQTACTDVYSKAEFDKKTEVIVDGVNYTYNVAVAAANKAFEKEIAGCQKENKIYDIPTGKCVEAKK